MTQIDERAAPAGFREFMVRMAAATNDAVERESVLSLAILDVDEFDALNRRHGTEAGDGVLRALEAALAESFGGEVEVGRIGGDEYGAILAGVEPEDAFLSLERVRQAVADFETEVPFTVSAGVAAYPKDGKSGPEILRKADAGLFRAKALGRNRVCLPPDEKMVPKTSHFTRTQLEQLSALAVKQERGEADLLREALDDLLFKYRR